jgi:hypothetical protein
MIAGVVGLGGARAVDQFQRFGVARGAVGERVAERVERVHVVGFGDEDAAEIGFRARDVVAALPLSAREYSSAGSSGYAASPRANTSSSCAAAVLPAQFGFEQVRVAARVVVRRRIALQLAQRVVGFVAALEFVQHVGCAQARGPARFAAGHAAIPLQRLGCA